MKQKVGGTPLLEAVVLTSGVGARATVGLGVLPEGVGAAAWGRESNFVK